VEAFFRTVEPKVRLYEKHFLGGRVPSISPTASADSRSRAAHCARVARLRATSSDSTLGHLRVQECPRCATPALHGTTTCSRACGCPRRRPHLGPLSALGRVRARRRLSKGSWRWRTMPPPRVTRRAASAGSVPPSGSPPATSQANPRRCPPRVAPRGTLDAEDRSALRVWVAHDLPDAAAQCDARHLAEPRVLKNEWALLPLRVRGSERVQLPADLTILAKLACALRPDAGRAARGLGPLLARRAQRNRGRLHQHSAVHELCDCSSTGVAQRTGPPEGARSLLSWVQS
jgi:hypothetical protein